MIKYLNGDQYQGDLVEGKKNGFGIMQDKFGNVYWGEFKDDKMEGVGTIFYINGSTYKGLLK